MNNELRIKNIFAAVFEKSVLDELLEVLDKKTIKFWGTEGTVNYLKKNGFSAKSILGGFDFDGRVKSLDRKNFVRILADKSKKKHILELKKNKLEPLDLVIVDLYAPDKKNFPETMDIGGQALIRAAAKNYKNVGVVFDAKSIGDIAKELKKNGGLTLAFRKKLAKKALNFIAKRGSLEAKLFS